jgi:ubiquinone/menaquinone biosynthesis C-methylase UbiE
MCAMSTAIPITNAERPKRVARWNAWFFDTFDGVIDRRLHAPKAELFRDLPSTVVEIGAGTGANLRYYPAGTTVIAIEPSAAMHAALAQRAEGHRIDVRIEESSVERLPFADASVDVVVSTLVLCSVDDPDTAIAEIHRVLRPGGRFLFLEHVIAPRPGLLRTSQRLIRRPWSRLFDGCDTCRDTEATIRSLTWSRVDIAKRRPFDPVFFPVSQQIYGSVTR